MLPILSLKLTVLIGAVGVSGALLAQALPGGQRASSFQQTVDPVCGTSAEQHTASGGVPLHWEVRELPDLAGAAKTVATVLEANRTRVLSPVGQRDGFLPGPLYAEVYARDLYTAGKAAQYLYPSPVLRGGIDVFLSHQLQGGTPNIGALGVAYPRPGALPGYAARDGSAGKTTAVSDEETSTIQLAHLYYQAAGGAAWLQCEVNGVRVIDRLNRAAEALLVGRMDVATGLLRRAHTTDWGDVRQQGGRLPTVSPSDAEETWTASIFDQAWAYLALQDLATMNRDAGNTVEAAAWARSAAKLKENTNRDLWQGGWGHYRLHRHLTPLEHEFNEDAMVAIGNAIAVYAGLASPSQAAHVFSALEVARLQAGSLKPGLSLFPPYPHGFFQHEQLHQPGSYQNGGQWDWWAGMQMTAEYENGHAELAWKHLTAVVKDWATHPDTVAEWQTPQTNAQWGSPKYAGAAGTVAEAVIRGAFGVSLSQDRLELRPRLGARSGFLQVGLPSPGPWVWIQVTSQPNGLTLTYNTDHHRPAVLAPMLPPTAGQVVEVRLNGVPHAVREYTVSQDRYIDAGEVAPGHNTLSIVWK